MVFLTIRIDALFNRAENFLDQMQGADLIKWKDKVRVIPVTHGYVTPKIKDEIQGVIYESLLREKQFTGKYLSREATKSKKAIFNPLAIVSHGVVTRVICTREIDGQTDNIIRYLPIHRFKSVSPLEDKINIPNAFNLDDYLSCQILFSNDGQSAWVGQPHLISNLEKVFGDEVKGLRKYLTPGTPGMRQVREEQITLRLDKVKHARYRSGVGMLLYLVKHSRPDIENCVRELSKVLDGPSDVSYREMLRCV